MTCYEMCEKCNFSCDETECRNYIEYEEDLNCVLVCVRKNGSLTLEQTAKRLGVSYVRIKQIEEKAMGKIKSRMAEDEMVI